MITLRTWILLVLASTVALLHSFALAFELYWILPWFDIGMHFFGGATVALLLYALMDFKVPVPLLANSLGGFLLVVLAIAIGWEVFEVWVGIAMAPNYVLDTSVDIVMGLLGCFVGFYLGRALHTL